MQIKKNVTKYTMNLSICTETHAFNFKDPAVAPLDRPRHPTSNHNAVDKKHRTNRVDITNLSVTWDHL